MCDAGCIEVIDTVTALELFYTSAVVLWCVYDVCCVGMYLIPWERGVFKSKQESCSECLCAVCVLVGCWCDQAVRPRCDIEDAAGGVVGLLVLQAASILPLLKCLQ
jgi:hypothetical protein